MPLPYGTGSDCVPVMHVHHVQRRHPRRHVLFIRRRLARRRAGAATAPCGASISPQAAAQRPAVWRGRWRAVCAAWRLTWHLQVVKGLC